MGNVLGFHNLKEKLCQSCYDDYQTSLNVGSEPLSDVAERGHAHCLRTLIEAGAVSKNSEWRDVLTSALTSAAHSGHLACMRVLVEVGADVNQAETLSHSPLTLAAERGQKEAIKFLIDKGADVNAVNHMYTALARAAMYRQYNCVHTLLKAGADVNMVVNMGYTALMYAAQSGSHSCVKLLIQAGADVNITNIDGNTALFSSANGTRKNASNRELRLDVNTEVDVNGEDNEITRIKCTKELLQSGVKINLVNKKNLNALRSYISNCEDQNKLPDRTMVLLLYAAGETLDSITVDEDDDKVCDLGYLQRLEISLKNICRDVIREHLLDLDPHTHLFGKVSRLGLPRSLSDYLLYGQSLRSDSSSD